ncbi:outer membrane protein assembly factor BamD [Bacteroidota bacterium]|nr:outer membrane protein assembly factor BamD [Bacteroidota bacterium]
MFSINRILKNLAAFLFFISCNSYQKMINSKEIAPKLKAAQKYYDDGEYRRANRLYEQIIPSYRGKPQAQRLIYFFANSHYELGNYYLAAYQFESFVKSFPKSEKLDEANFMIAKCYYMLSPNYSLDQENTNEAMEKLQIFIDNYPNSIYSTEANNYIRELQIKLEKKDFEISKQYYTIRDYKAAISSLDNFISNFPGTPYRENALYYKFISQYEIATNSVPSKRLERLEGAKDTYEAILRYYPESLFMEDISEKLDEIQKQIKKIKDNNT